MEDRRKECQTIDLLGERLNAPLFGNTLMMSVDTVKSLLGLNIELVTQILGVYLSRGTVVPLKRRG